MSSDLERIYRAGLKFLAPLTPEKTYRIIVYEAVKLVDGDNGIIMLQIKGKLKPIYQSPFHIPLSAHPRKDGLAYRAFRKREAFVAHKKEIHRDSARAGIKSVIFIPLANRNKSIGVLAIRSYKEDHFTDSRLKILKLFGSMASLAIRKMQLYEEVKQAMEARDLFISMAAHEFRTPLTTIGGYAQLLATKFPKNGSPLSRWVEELSWETNRLTSLVNELLEVSRMKGGQFQYMWRECHLVQIINRAVSEFQFSHSGRRLRFDNQLKNDQDLIVGDFDKLLQVLSNLLDNAAKFSPPDKEIRITLKSSTTHLSLSIKDSGQGIENEILPGIFEGFHKGNKDGTEGMGLGLFIARSIIVQHHGSLNIRTKVGEGTTVKVKLLKTKL